MRIETPITIWLTGLPSSGKTTLGKGLQDQLLRQNHTVILLDGDDFRKGVCSDLGFSEKDRFENIRRAASAAKLLNSQGSIVICCFVSPMIAMRRMAKDIIGASNFCEVFVDASLEVCSNRDAKGLYRKASEGLLLNLTGISAPYEKPLSPKIHIKTDEMDVVQSLEFLYHSVLEMLKG